MVSTPLPQRMKVSRQGLLLIKSFEGFRPQAVRRRDGTLVIGYGHSQTARPGVTISEAEAELLLQHDLIPVVAAIQHHVRLPLNQHQFDALASFILSIGLDRFVRSDVLEQLNLGSAERAGRALSGWPDRTPPPVDALYRRRSAEKALFETAPDSPSRLDLLLTAPVLGPASSSVPTEETHSSTVPVMRHETGNPRRPDRADLGALVFIGSVGALAVAAGALAFQRTLAPTQAMSLSPSLATDHTLWLGGFLLIMGVIFIAAAVWNLLRKQNNKRPA